MTSTAGLAQLARTLSKLDSSPGFPAFGQAVLDLGQVLDGPARVQLSGHVLGDSPGLGDRARAAPSAASHAPRDQRAVRLQASSSAPRYAPGTQRARRLQASSPAPRYAPGTQRVRRLQASSPAPTLQPRPTSLAPPPGRRKRAATLPAGSRLPARRRVRPGRPVRADIREGGSCALELLLFYAGFDF